MNGNKCLNFPLVILLARSFFFRNCVVNIGFSLKSVYLSINVIAFLTEGGLAGLCGLHQWYANEGP